MLPPIPSVASHDAYFNQLAVFYAVWFAIGVSLMFATWRAKRSQIELTPAPAWALWAIIAIAFFVRIPNYLQMPWYDEVFTHTLAVADSLRPVVLADVHPPTYTAFVKVLYALFEPNILIARIPSMIAGLLFVWLVHRVARDEGAGERAALLAALLAAMMEVFIYYSAEARYPMILGLAALYAYWGHRHDKPFRVFTGLTLVAYSHSIGVVYAGLMGLAFIVTARTKAQRGAIVAAGVLAIFPLILTVMQRGDVSDGFWLRHAGPFALMRMGLFSQGTPRHFEFTASLATLTVAVSTTTMLFTGGLRTMRNNKTLLWCILAPPTILYAITVFWSPIYLSRAMMPSMALALPAMALYLAQRSKVIQLAVIALCIIMTSIGYLSLRDVFYNMDDCEGYSHVHSITTWGAIIGGYAFQDAIISVYENPDNTQQELTDEAREAMGIVHTSDPASIAEPYCTIALVDMWITDEQYSYMGNLDLDWIPTLIARGYGGLYTGRSDE